MLTIQWLWCSLVTHQTILKISKISCMLSIYRSLKTTRQKRDLLLSKIHRRLNECQRWPAKAVSTSWSLRSLTLWLYRKATRNQWVPIYLKKCSMTSILSALTRQLGFVNQWSAWKLIKIQRFMSSTNITCCSKSRKADRPIYRRRIAYVRICPESFNQLRRM